jgi:hypothetical protein
MIKGKKIPMVNIEMDLVFQHLYDDNYGVIANERMWGKAELVLIMPSEFTPRLGESYTCVVSSTMGSFVYNGRKYKFYIARRKDNAGFIDEIDFEVGQEMTKGEFKNNPFEVLKNLK